MLAEILWDEKSIAVVAVFGSGAVITVAYFYFKFHTARSEMELKQSMVQRGMSAEEIERVMASGRRGE